jgi:hypothetical protein
MRVNTMFDIDHTRPKGFEPPPGVCQTCGNESNWRMIKVGHNGDWRAGYCHNVLTGYETGKPVDWNRVEMRQNLEFKGWLEFCNNCEPQPHTPTGMAVTAKEAAAHADATPETIRAMLATMQMKELPYDKNDRDIY